MAVNRDKLFDSISNGAAWDAGVVFNRTNGIPIDKYSVFETYEAASDYALNNPVAYPGQYIAVVAEDNTVQPYIIGNDGSLEEFGGKIELPLSLGEGENSLETANSSALSANSIATGNSTISGGKGFKVLAQYTASEAYDIYNMLKPLEQGHGIYVIAEGSYEEISSAVQESNFDKLPNLLRTKTLQYSIVLNSASYHCGNIVNIGHGINLNNEYESFWIEVDNFEKIDFNAKKDDPDNCNVYNFLIVDGHPELGNINVGFNAATFGQDTLAQNLNSFATGIGSKALGKHSFVAGMYNIAGHNAAAFGNGCYALGDMSFLAGHHLRCEDSEQTVVGRYNKPVNDALFVVGCGTSHTDKKNALVVYKDGTTEIVDPNININLEKLYLTDGETAPLVGGFPIFSFKEDTYYIINTYAFKSEMSNDEGTGLFDKFKNGEELHVIITNEEGAHYASKVTSMWAHTSDYSKIGFKLETYYPVTSSDIVTFVEYPELGNPIELVVPRFVIGNDNYSLSSNGIVAGEGLVAYDKNTSVLGTYNEYKDGQSFVIGNGTDDENRSNAFEVDDNGDVYVKGKVYVGGTGANRADAKEVGTNNWTEIKNRPGLNEGSDNTAVQTTRSKASGSYSFAEGCFTEASGDYSHAGGYDSVAEGVYSFAHGEAVNATARNQTVFGTYNEQNDDALFIIGNGEYVPMIPNSTIIHRNAFEVMKNGDVNVQRSLKVNNGKTVATINDVADLKDELLNGAGDAYDTLKELGTLIDTNKGAVEALREVATNKADKDHNHNDTHYIKTEIDEKVSTLNTSISDSLETAKTYADTAIAQAQSSVIQIRTWEEDD